MFWWFWVALVGLSWYGSGLLIISAWEAFRNNPISFVVDTNYINWETKMPAIAICEYPNHKMVYNVSDTIWTTNHPADLEDVLLELSFFRGALVYTLDFCYKYTVHPLCPNTNISAYVELVRRKCVDMLTFCSYNGKSFDCCEYFQKIATNMGDCYILNSLQTENPKPYPMITNRTSPEGVIKLELTVPAMVFTIGEDEVPSVTSSKITAVTAGLGFRYTRHLTLRNIENDPLVVETTPEQRACRFNDENEGGIYPHHSYSACTVQCRKAAIKNTCGCYDHFTPGVDPKEHCNMTGLACMVQHFNELSTLKPQWANRAGLACDCLPSCTETEVTVVKDEITPDKKNKRKSVVVIKLASLPSEKFKRNVVRGRLDLVVSVGGTTGLFVGASLLSFAELIVYFSIRYINNNYMVKKEHKNTIDDTAIVIPQIIAPDNLAPYPVSGVYEYDDFGIIK